jgi:hypothetical protein
MNFKEFLVDSVDGHDKDWELVMIPVSEPFDPFAQKIQKAKLKVYVKELKKGSLFPPIVVDEKNEVIDGTHRLRAHKVAKYRKILAMRPIGKGTGQLLGEMPRGDFFIPSEEPPNCFGCGAILNFCPYGATLSPLPTFPEGLPRGPFFYCERCGITVSKKTFMGWAVVRNDKR